MTYSKAGMVKLLTGIDVDAALRWPVGRADKLARRGTIPHIRLPDGSVLFRAADLRAMLKSGSISPASDLRGLGAELVREAQGVASALSGGQFQEAQARSRIIAELGVGLGGGR